MAYTLDERELEIIKRYTNLCKQYYDFDVNMVIGMVGRICLG